MNTFREYLEEIKNITSESMAAIKTTELSGISNLQKDIISNKEKLDLSMDKVYKLRNDLYENLISAELGNIFLRKAIPFMADYKKSEDLISFLNSDFYKTNYDGLMNSYKISEQGYDVHDKINNYKKNLFSKATELKDLLNLDNYKITGDINNPGVESTVKYLVLVNGIDNAVSGSVDIYSDNNYLWNIRTYYPNNVIAQSNFHQFAHYHVAHKQSFSGKHKVVVMIS